MRVEFSAEDATRSDRKFLLQVFKSVSDVHVDRIDIPDTVGYATPPYIESLVNDIIEITKVPSVCTVMMISDWRLQTQ
jgi:2-isopropylmalate synthase